MTRKSAVSPFDVKSGMSLRNLPGLPNTAFRWIILIGVVFIIYGFHSFFNASYAPAIISIFVTRFEDIRPPNPAPVSKDAIFNCLMEKFGNGTLFDAGWTWLYLQEAVKECRQPADKSIIAEMFFGDEPKYFIPGPTPDFKYNMLTLGVGQNIAAEVKIKNKYPGCINYVAVDPTTDFNEDLVKNAGGHFLQRTVGATNDVSTALILNSKSHYEKTEVPHTTLQTIFKEANMTEVVDIMMMDIEGAEFEILDSFIDQSSNETTICQFNVEMHNPWSNAVKKSAIIHTLYRLSQKRKFLIFNAEVIQIERAVFNRCFFINVESRYCVQKYYPSLQ